MATPTAQMVSLGFTGTRSNISESEFQIFQRIINDLDPKDPQIAAALDPDRDQDNLAGKGFAPPPEGVTGSVYRDDRTDPVTVPAASTPADPVAALDPGRDQDDLGITGDRTGTAPAVEAEPKVAAKDPPTVVVDKIAIAGVGVQIQAFETTIKTFDNTQRNVTYTDPTDGSVHQVTARQNAILQEFAKFDAGDSMYDERLKLEKLFAKAIADPASGPPADAEDPEDEPKVPKADDPDPKVVAGVDTPPPTTATPSLLKEFLDSDPDLMLNVVLNRFRDNGSNQIFLRWFRNNFDRFWGEYLGRVGGQALDGNVPTVSFVDWVLGIDTVKEFFGESSVTRASSNNARFAAFQKSRN